VFARPSSSLATRLGPPPFRSDVPPASTITAKYSAEKAVYLSKVAKEWPHAAAAAANSGG
jgi:hypothetical protein